MGKLSQARPHIIVGPGGRLQCMHCGKTHNLFQADGSGIEIGAMDALGKWFSKEHRGCRKPKRPLCPFCLTPDHPWDQHVNQTTRAPGDWPDCGDTGTSSEAIWHHMMGQSGAPALRKHDHHPHDPADFGRCVRLLAAPWAVGWRARIGEMAAYGPAWVAFAGAWDELEALFREETSAPDAIDAPRLYVRMKMLRGIDP